MASTPAGWTRPPALSLLALAIAAVASLLAAGPAAAKPTCQGQQATIVGTPQNETIEGTSGADVIRARAGNDTILAGAGEDVICSGLGADNAEGGDGGDSINGGDGNDTVDAGSGDDHVFGHGGEDTATGGPGTDECRVDTHSECEADLRLNLTGPAAVTHGGGGVFVFEVDVKNNGLTPAASIRTDLVLPQNPELGTVEFVPAESDSRCSPNTATTLRCNLGGLGVNDTAKADVALRFPDCFLFQARRAPRGFEEQPTDTLSGTTRDQGTSDPVPGNDADSTSFEIDLDESCFNN